VPDWAILYVGPFLTTGAPQMSGYFFPKGHALILTTNGLGCILGDSSGVDVMITIFRRFFPIFGEKLAFFLNTNVMINFYKEYSFVLSQKRHFFRKIFQRKY
jgi:hypothetical protein